MRQMLSVQQLRLVPLGLQPQLRLVALRLQPQLRLVAMRLPFLGVLP